MLYLEDSTIKKAKQWERHEPMTSWLRELSSTAATTFLSSADDREGKNRRIALKSLNEITFFLNFLDQAQTKLGESYGLVTASKGKQREASAKLDASWGQARVKLGQARTS